MRHSPCEQIAPPRAPGSPSRPPRSRANCPQSQVSHRCSVVGQTSPRLQACRRPSQGAPTYGHQEAIQAAIQGHRGSSRGNQVPSLVIAHHVPRPGGGKNQGVPASLQGEPSQIFSSHIPTPRYQGRKEGTSDSLSANHAWTQINTRLGTMPVILGKFETSPVNGTLYIL